ncbi:uncharacterized protein LOC130956672 [Arachis stenosperma]|uniref:uncharacterized protein LOC130956672 n=1 Tax=Arachis stenosperma TaxID=217475 RepID=UPI0025AC0AC5|nr:uncharacterized protein LOC130956672 [Arachis stenosperma]
MGFCQKWIGWMQEYVTTVSYSVLVDGFSHGFFKPTRGLRQGDPLSPYLLLICAEGLSHLLHKGEQRHEFSGLWLNRWCPTISHLFFANDSILFEKVNAQTCQNLLHLLREYSEISGQVTNLNKSSIFFSQNMPEELRNEIAKILQVLHVRSQDKYLGLPAVVNR